VLQFSNIYAAAMNASNSNPWIHFIGICCSAFSVYVAQHFLACGNVSVACMHSWACYTCEPAMMRLIQGVLNMFLFMTFENGVEKLCHDQGSKMLRC